MKLTIVIRLEPRTSSNRTTSVLPDRSSEYRRLAASRCNRLRSARLPRHAQTRKTFNRAKLNLSLHSPTRLSKNNVASFTGHSSCQHNLRRDCLSAKTNDIETRQRIKSSAKKIPNSIFQPTIQTACKACCLGCFYEKSPNHQATCLNKSGQPNFRSPHRCEHHERQTALAKDTWFSRMRCGQQ